MKKIIKTIALCLVAAFANAQPYGERLISHSGTFLSSGNIAPNNSGYLISGYSQTNLTGNPNFYIDKTDQSGNFTGSFFTNDYKIYRDNACGTTPPQALNCVGVTVIETPNLTDPYALTGAVNDGCFYASLDAAGMPVQKMFYPFPSGSFAVTKPMILEHPMPGHGLVICGSYRLPGQLREMYVITIDVIGNVQQSKIYHCGLGLWPPCTVPHGLELDPHAMLISPYTNSPNNTTELVIVGEAAYYSAATCIGGPVPSHSSGFFLRIDLLNNLQWITNTIYNYQNGQGVQQQMNFFTSVVPSNAMGSPGFSVGGFTDMNLGSGGSASWVVKLDQIGNLMQSETLASSYDPSTKAVKGIIERLDTYGINSQFAVAMSSAGLLCYKLDDNFQPYTSVNAIDNVNEFLYATGGTPAYAQAISFDDSGAPWGQGIQIYGNKTNDCYFVQAAFNGYSEFTACGGSSTNNLATTTPGPHVFNTTNVNQLPGLMNCQNFNLTAANAIVSVNKLCNVAALPAAGSNAKITGIVNNKKEINALGIYPNPVTGIAKIKYNNAGSQPTNFELYNNLGQLVYTVKATEQTNEVEIDLGKLNLESGIYFIKTNVNGTGMQQKIIYSKK